MGSEMCIRDSIDSAEEAIRDHENASHVIYKAHYLNLKEYLAAQYIISEMIKYNHNSNIIGRILSRNKSVIFESAPVAGGLVCSLPLG